MQNRAPGCLAEMKVRPVKILDQKNRKKWSNIHRSKFSGVTHERFETEAE